MGVSASLTAAGAATSATAVGAGSSASATGTGTSTGVAVAGVLLAAAAGGATSIAAAGGAENFSFSTPWLTTTARSRPVALMTVASRCAGELMRNSSLEKSSSLPGIVASDLTSSTLSNF